MEPFDVCGYYVLVEIPEVQKKESFIHIPEDIKASEIQGSAVGYVRGIGPTAFGGMSAIDGDTSEIRAKEWGVKIGDKVEFTRYDGKKPVTPGYENHRLIQDQMIIGVVGGNNV